MSSRFAWAAAFILALAAGYSCWRQTPLIWDGAYQFNATLIMQQPYFYLTRFHTYFLWWPTVWASRVTSNVAVLQAIYGVPFLFAPVLSLVLSWWIVRKHAPHLLIWVLFGMCAGSLPGQIFVINDSIFQLHLFWPVFVGLFVPLTLPKKIVIGVLAAFQFVHPLGVMLFFGATAAALLTAMVDKPNRRRLLLRAGVMASLVILTAAKVFITTRIPALYDSYAAEEARWTTARDRWIVGVRGWPLHGLWFMWSAAFMVLVWMRVKSRLHVGVISLAAVVLMAAGAAIVQENRQTPGDAAYALVACVAAFVFLLLFSRRGGPSRLAASLPLLCITTAAACWVHWAGDGHLWWKAIDYRRWVGPLSAPFMIFATFDAMLRGWGERTNLQRSEALPGELSNGPTISAPIPVVPSRQNVVGPASLLLAVTFALVLGVQSTLWHNQSARLMNTVNGYGRIVVPESAAPWMRETPLDHWATGDYVMAMQGKTPSRLLLDPRGEEHIYETPPKIPHWDFYPRARADHPDPTPGPAGWFDLRPLLAKLAAEPPDNNPTRTQRLDVKSTPE